jgi:cullin 1
MLILFACVAASCCPCCHADRVYSEVKRNARAALLRQIERERDGDMIDRSLLKNILDIFIEVRF